jgi:putrescine---pyruvate transaminase
MMETEFLRPGDNESKWLRAEIGQRILQPMAHPAVTRATKPPVIMRGKGVHVTDLDGREMIDCQGGLWCVNAGYGRQEIIDAVTSQLHELPYYTNFPGSTTAPAMKLAARLCEIAAPEGMAKVIFGSGGSDATESAFKIARQYWKIVGQPERVKVISLRGGYHGLHFGGVSACGGDAWRRSYEPLMPGFYSVESPNLYRPPFEAEPEALAKICANLLEREIQFQVADTVAAVIAEPIQGAGGVHVPPANYWPLLREICDRHGVLLIADEVITGLGRAGDMFGSRLWGVKPDIMCLAKGISSGYIPLSATLFNARIADAFETDGFRSVVMHGYTYSGHPVACAAGLAAIDLTLRDDLAGNARVVGDYLLNKLLPLKERFPVIGDIRGKGLMIAIELVKDRNSKEAFSPTDSYPSEVSDLFLKHGVMLRTIVNKFIISPPLILTKAHADEIVRVVELGLSTHPYRPN